MHRFSSDWEHLTEDYILPQDPRVTDRLQSLIHEVGKPFYFDVELEFDENRLLGTFNWQPIGWSVEVQGTRD